MAFESLVWYSRLLGENALRKRDQPSSIDSLSVVALQSHGGNVHTEQAFHHFLNAERLRAARSGRALFLLLVSLRQCPERGTRIGTRVATSLLQGLGPCVREIDVVGWYRDNRVVGAVLPQGFEAPAPDTSKRIVARVTRVLSDHVPPSVAARLRVRLVRLGSPSK